MKRLTVMDLFCGAGGFSEGFRQMGFDIVYAVDNWGPAVRTIEETHPGTEVVKADVLDLDPSDMPKVDVIIGGPPCVEFSYSKRGGGGDIKKGMRLVLRFLYFIQKLKPRWWIMENVPRLLNTLPSEVKLDMIGIGKLGSLKIPQRNVLNASDYGTPQKRLRLISGRYPSPIQTHTELVGVTTLTNRRLRPWRNMREIIEGLPDPLKDFKGDTVVKDPNYDISMPIKELKDHFGLGVFTDEEAEKNKNAKMNHPFYGKMKFPDDLDRPSRTVMATQFNASRETMVIQGEMGKKTVFRKPTIRECACLQGFPITYKFNGSSAVTTKYKLVGNAVPIMLSAAIAKAILKEANLPIPRRPILH